MELRWNFRRSKGSVLFKLKVRETFVEVHNAKRRGNSEDRDGFVRILAKAFANSKDGNFFRAKFKPIAPWCLLLREVFRNSKHISILPPSSFIVYPFIGNHYTNFIHVLFSTKLLSAIYSMTRINMARHLVPHMFILYSLPWIVQQVFFYKNRSWRRHVRCQWPDRTLTEFTVGLRSA